MLPNAPPHTPREKWCLIEKARRELLLMESAAIEAALQEADWLVMRAARLLRPDTASHQWLASMLRPGGRHAALGASVRQRNAERGYVTGKPPSKEASR